MVQTKTRDVKAGEYDNVYLSHPDDGITTCPICGARTVFEEFHEDGKDKQIHACLNPDHDYTFILEPDEDIALGDDA